MAGPLTGIRVLDLSRVLAGPWCTMTLADLGAEVIKVEEPGVGEEHRNTGGPRIAGEPVIFLYYNRNKKGITLNLKHAEGQAIALELARSSDVLVHNFRTGFVQRAGLGYETVKRYNERIVYCSVTAFGEGGPYGHEGGGDLHAIGLAGIMSITGTPEGPPMRPGLSFIDLMTGDQASTGILAALWERERTGRGQKVSVNLLDTAIAALGHYAGWYFATGSSPGRYSPALTPYHEPTGTYRTADNRHINIGAARSNWPKLCRVLGVEHLIDDPRVKTPEARERYGVQVRAILAEVLATRTAAEWLETLRAADVNCSPVNSVQEALEDPQVAYNRMVMDMRHPLAGVLKMLRCPIRLDDNARVSGDGLPPPTLGQHTEEVLCGRLGKTPDEIAQLRARGVI